MIELAEMIAELRRELYRAIEAGRDEPLQFTLGPVEVEATVGVRLSVIRFSKHPW